MLVAATHETATPLSGDEETRGAFEASGTAWNGGSADVACAAAGLAGLRYQVQALWRSIARAPESGETSVVQLAT